VRPRNQDAAYLRAFGAAVRQARERAGLSQEELGFRADLDRTYISGVERGARNPTVRSILTIAEALATRPSRLLGKAEARLPRP
jgi:transcriptional regulator with XRE-family HTH domain